MPRSDAPVEVIDDSEDEQPKSPKKKNAKDTQDNDNAADKSASGNEEEDEEEYEIEAILEAKFGIFPPVRSSFPTRGATWVGHTP